MSVALALFDEIKDPVKYEQDFEDNVAVLVDRIKETGEQEISLEQNHFADGVYARELFIPKGQILVGAKHKTEHLNVVLKGEISIATREGIIFIEAPCIFKSDVGIRKVGLAHEDTIWLTVHPTKETDVEKIENDLVEKNVVMT